MNLLYAAVSQTALVGSYAGGLYAVTTMSIAFVATLSRDRGRRTDARRILEILLRRTDE
ncbi:Uncharacterised protein [Nocardia brasiliensis]|nr:Uncharacterised protein [Nocardia brasiliensis]